MSFFGKLIDGLFGGGKKAPTYDREREADKTRIQGEYDTAANNWNTAATSFNTALTGLSGRYEDMSNRSRNLNIADLDGINAFENDLSSFRTSLNNLDLGMDRPTFSSTQTLYGQSVPFSVPTLQTANTRLRDNLLNDLSGLTSTLSSIRSGRANEERRVADFGADLNTDLAALGTMLQGLGIADESGLNSARATLASIDTRARNFNSPLGFTPSYAEGFDPTTIGARIDDLFGQRGQEQNRISAYESDIFGLADTIRSGLQGLGITDIDRITALDDQLETRRRDAQRFSSVLPFDLSQELAALGDVDALIEDLKTRRVNEEARISNAREQFTTDADFLADATGALDIYSRPQIDAIQNSLARTRRDMGRFASDLPTDFADIETGLSSVDAALQDILGRRTTALDEARQRAQGFAQAAGEIPLQDEDALRAKRDTITSARSTLNRFTGSDADAVLGEYDTAISTVDARLAQLTARRAEIESQAQQLLEQANSNSFYYQDDLGGPQAQLASLRSDADLFRAQQALDEIAAIERRLTSEKTRLEADAAQVRARQEQERLALQGSGQASPNDFLTSEEYQAYLTRRRQEDPLFIAASPTSFAASLGVA